MRRSAKTGLLFLQSGARIGRDFPMASVPCYIAARNHKINGKWYGARRADAEVETGAG